MREIYAGSVSHSEFFLLKDSSGNPVPSRTFADITGAYVRTRSVSVALSLIALPAVNSAYASGQFGEVNAGAHPGLYRYDVPDAVFASAAGVDQAIVTLSGSGIIPVSKEFRLIAWNNQRAIFPDVAAGQANGLPLLDNNTHLIVQLDGAQVWDVNTPATANTTARIMQLLIGQCGGKWGAMVITGQTSATVSVFDESGMHTLRTFDLLIDQTDPTNIKVISRS